jgi:hypothetical protein
LGKSQISLTGALPYSPSKIHCKWTGAILVLQVQLLTA